MIAFADQRRGHHWHRCPRRPSGSRNWHDRSRRNVRSSLTSGPLGAGLDGSHQRRVPRCLGIDRVREVRRSHLREPHVIRVCQGWAVLRSCWHVRPSLLLLGRHFCEWSSAPSRRISYRPPNQRPPRCQCPPSSLAVPVLLEERRRRTLEAGRSSARRCPRRSRPSWFGSAHPEALAVPVADTAAGAIGSGSTRRSARGDA